VATIAACPFVRSDERGIAAAVRDLLVFGSRSSRLTRKTGAARDPRAFGPWRLRAGRRGPISLTIRRDIEPVAFNVALRRISRVRKCAKTASPAVNFRTKRAAVIRPPVQRELAAAERTA